MHLTKNGDQICDKCNNVHSYAEFVMGVAIFFTYVIAADFLAGNMQTALRAG